MRKMAAFLGTLAAGAQVKQSSGSSGEIAAKCRSGTAGCNGLVTGRRQIDEEHITEQWGQGAGRQLRQRRFIHDRIDSVR